MYVSRPDKKDVVVIKIQSKSLSESSSCAHGQEKLYFILQKKSGRCRHHLDSRSKRVEDDTQVIDPSDRSATLQSS